MTSLHHKEQKNVNLMPIMLGVWLGNLQVAGYNYLLTIDIRIYVSIFLLCWIRRGRRSKNRKENKVERKGKKG